MPVLRVRPRRENRVDVRLWSDVGSQASVEKSLVSDLLRCLAVFRFPWNGNEPTGCVAARVGRDWSDAPNATADVSCGPDGDHQGDCISVRVGKGSVLLRSSTSVPA